MIVTHEREKLIQAINFFVRHTRECGKVKLYKLLYFLDFEHFKLTGRSVTGLTYYAWPEGPVPVKLHDEFDEIIRIADERRELLDKLNNPAAVSDANGAAFWGSAPEG